LNPFPSLEPLCPWEEQEHTGHYAEVDHSQVAFEDFQKAVSDGRVLTRKGMVVLTTGGSGCGKTSLMHRCAHWLDAHWRDGHPSACQAVQIINLTGDGRKGSDSEQRVRHIFERFADELELHLKPEEVQLLTDRRGDADRLAPALSKVLSAKSTIAVVLLPSSEVPDEVERYAGLVRKNILFLAETAFDNVAEHCGRRLGPTSATPVPQLRVGELTVEDGWRYVSHHFARHAGGPLPTVTEETMRTVVQKRGRMSVRELQILLHGKFEELPADGQVAALTFEDFSEYYFRTANRI